MNHIDVDLFAITVSLLILYDIYTRSDRDSLPYKLFIAILVVDIVLLALESAGWVVDGQPGPMYAWLNSSINIVLFILNPLPPYLWTLYADYQVFHDERRIKRIYGLLSVPLLVNAAASLATPLTGWMFYIGANNLYHRGPVFPLLYLACFGYIIYTFAIILCNRRRIEKRTFVSLLFFALPPVIGGILQTVFYGLTLLWSGVTLSILIVYINIQNRRSDTDYLTGLFNRMHSDHYLKNKVSSHNNEKPFSALLIDIDDFKEINDQFGHEAGDEALQIAANLIKSCLRKDDFIARYGGDEFLVILDIQNTSDLDNSVARVKESTRKFNASTDKPYKINLSLGYDIYDPDSGMNEDQFFNHIDALMYEDKKRSKAKQLWGSQ